MRARLANRAAVVELRYCRPCYTRTPIQRLKAGAMSASIDQLLEIIKRNKEWNEDAARKQLVKFFEAWGPKDEVTLSARRRLSSILFS